MKRFFLLLLLPLVLISCSDDDSSNNPETPSIKVSTTQANVMMPVAAGNTYIYKNISDSLIYDTLHPTNRTIFFFNQTHPITQSDETCYHSKDFTSFVNMDWQVCGVNKEKNLYMAAWGANYESLDEGEQLKNTMFFYDTLAIGTEVGELTYRGKESLEINGKTFVDCAVYDDYDEPTTGGPKKLKIYLYKGIGLLKTIQTSKTTGEVLEILTLQSCKIK